MNELEEVIASDDEACRAMSRAVIAALDEAGIGHCNCTIITVPIEEGRGMVSVTSWREDKLFYWDGDNLFRCAKKKIKLKKK